MERYPKTQESLELKKLGKANTADDFESLNVPLLLSIGISRTCLFVTTLAVFRVYFARMLPRLSQTELYDMFYFISSKRRIDMMELFFDHLTLRELEEADKERFFLHVAVTISLGCVDVITFLLDQGMDVDIRNTAGETPLFMACRCSKVDIIDLLLQKGADVNAKDIQGNTPVFDSLRQDDITILDRLIVHGADLRVVNIKDAGLWKLLISYSIARDKEIFYQRLVDMQVPVSQTKVNHFRAFYPDVDAEKKERLLKLLLSVQE